MNALKEKEKFIPQVAITQDLLDNVLTDQLLFEKFYKDYERFLTSLAYKKFSNISDPEEILSIAHIGFIKAIRTFQLDKEILFLTYMSQVVQNEILMFARKNNKLAKNGILPLSLDEKMEFIDGSESSIYEIIPDHKSDFNIKLVNSYDDYKLILETVKKVILRFSEKKQYAIKLYLNGWTQYEIGVKTNLSQSYISRIVKLFRKKLILELERISSKGYLSLENYFDLGGVISLDDDIRDDINDILNVDDEIKIKVDNENEDKIDNNEDNNENIIKKEVKRLSKEELYSIFDKMLSYKNAKTISLETKINLASIAYYYSAKKFGINKRESILGYNNRKNAVLDKMCKLLTKAGVDKDLINILIEKHAIKEKKQPIYITNEENLEPENKINEKENISEPLEENISEPLEDSKYFTFSLINNINCEFNSSIANSNEIIQELKELFKSLNNPDQDYDLTISVNIKKEG